MTLTLRLSLTLPPEPEQVSVKLLFWLSGPTDSLPEVALLPDHAPDAEQESVFCDDQVSVTLEP